MGQDKDSVRIDRWLLAIRMYKTRALAAEAISGGKIQINGQRAKAAKTVRVGDIVRIRKDPFEFVLEVQGLADKRGSAERARELYLESDESLEARQQLAETLRLERESLPDFPRGIGRPTKRDRRKLLKFRNK